MIPATLSHYRILGPVGRGGMGEVYAAEDTKLHRRIALKILPEEMAADRERLHRFEREARAVAALNHPNVVTIYSIEQANDLHFLTMELVDGKNLSDGIPSEGFPLPQFLDLSIPMVKAIAAAHKVGIVHRDLKPANVMLGTDGRIKILDFGLAKLREEVPTRTEEGTATLVKITREHAVVGTAAYMSPEQAEGKETDPRSDIFSAGVVLYEMSTGVRPFSGDSTMSVISSILRDVPPPPSDVRPHLPVQLDRIIARCLAKDPDRRYQSALDLCNDLEELRGSAEVSRRTRRRMRIRIPPTVVTTLIAAIAVLVILSIVWLSRGPVRQPEPAAPFRATFTQLTSTPGAELYPSLSPDGKWFVYSGEASGHRNIYLQSVGGQLPINLTADNTSDDLQPAFSPDGERIAFRSEREGGGLFVMGRTGEGVRRLTRNGFNPTWSPDGKQIAYATENVEIAPLNYNTASSMWVVSSEGREPRRLTDHDAVQPNWSPHGDRIVYVRRILEPASAQEPAGKPFVRRGLWTVPAGGGEPTVLIEEGAADWSPVWSPDGKYIYFSSDRGGSMNLWRIAVDEKSGSARGAPEPITTPATFLAHISISRDGSRIAYSSVLQTQNIQRLALDPTTLSIRGEPYWLTTGSRLWSSPDPSPDGEWIAFYSRGQPEGDLYVVRRDGTGLRQVTGDEAIDRVPRWSPDGQWITHFSNRETGLRLFKVRPDGSDLQRVSDTEAALAVWAPDGSRVAVSSVPAGKIYIFDPSRPWDQQKIESLETPDGFIPLSWSPDGRRLAGQTGEWATTGLMLYSFETESYERLLEYGEWPAWIDDRRILFVSGGREFSMIDTTTKEVTRLFSVDRDVIGPPRLTRAGDIYFSRRSSEADIWVATLETRNTGSPED